MTVGGNGSSGAISLGKIDPLGAKRLTRVITVDPSHITACQLDQCFTAQQPTPVMFIGKFYGHNDEIKLYFAFLFTSDKQFLL